MECVKCIGKIAFKPNKEKSIDIINKFYNYKMNITQIN